MPIVNSLTTVTTASTIIITPTAASIHDPVDVTIYNGGAVPIYIGGVGVTTSTGIPVASTLTSSMTLVVVSEPLYAIVTTGTATVRVMATRQ